VTLGPGCFLQDRKKSVLLAVNNLVEVQSGRLYLATEACSKVCLPGVRMVEGSTVVPCTTSGYLPVRPRTRRSPPCKTSRTPARGDTGMRNGGLCHRTMAEG